MDSTNTCKCDVCGKPVVSDKDQFVICKECQEAMNSDKEEIGGDG